MLSNMEEFTMSNVVALETHQPKKIETPIQWVKNLFEKRVAYCRKERKRKIDTLMNATYDFYLDLYLTGVELNKLVDIHPALYKERYTICTLAYRQAREALIPILEEDKVDECYANLQKYLQKKEGNNGRGNGKRVIFGNWGAKKSTKKA